MHYKERDDLFSVNRKFEPPYHLCVCKTIIQFPIKVVGNKSPLLNFVPEKKHEKIA